MPPKGHRRYKNWLTDGFPGWLQARLEEHGWQAIDLAAAMGTNSSVISNYMTEARKPDPKMLNRIADILNVSDVEIFTAAGYLRNMPLADDPPRVELIRKMGLIELTPDRYDILRILLDGILTLDRAGEDITPAEEPVSEPHMTARSDP